MTTKTANATRLHTHSAALILAAALLVPAASRAEVLYVSTLGNTIEKFDMATGSYLGVFANTFLNHPRGLAFDREGNLYAANSGNNTIAKFTPAGVGSVFASTGLYWPNDLAFDREGNLFGANGGDNSIEKFTRGGSASRFASGSGLNAPNGLAFDNAGNLFVANYRYADAAIVKFTPSGSPSVFASAGLVYPVGLAIDNAGNVFAANQYNNTIEKFTAAGTSSLFDNTGLSDPMGLTLDSAGDLYVANQGGWIEKVNPWGVASTLANPGWTGDHRLLMGIAIQPVPEPSTWALLGLGIPALLAFRRRKA